jgi:hypothetical protein
METCPHRPYASVSYGRLRTKIILVETRQRGQCHLKLENSKVGVPSGSFECSLMSKVGASNVLRAQQSWGGASSEYFDHSLMSEVGGSDESFDHSLVQGRRVTESFENTTVSLRHGRVCVANETIEHNKQSA